MTHQILLEIPDEVYQPILQRAQATGQTVAGMVQEWLAASVHRVPPASPARRWIGAFETTVPDAAERHHDYLGPALRDDMQARSGE